jgi:alpha-maltose-1-phosphate synthase
VIASTNTGAEDLFAHGDEGFIVPIRDPRAIRDCLIRLADEPQLRARMSAAAIERVKGLCGWSSYGDRFTTLLAEMNGLRSGARGASSNLETMQARL